ncbi:MAG: ATP-binding protein [Bacteroidia bacterium]|nr:ATP-binding protein [Bacteroidia bacterium]
MNLHSTEKALLIKKTTDFQPVNQQKGEGIDYKQLLDEYTYAVAHDFNTPLRQIKTYLGLLREDLSHKGLDADSWELMERVLENVERVQKQHKALREYANIGFKDLSLEKISLDGLTVDILRSFQRRYSMNLLCQLEHVSIELDVELLQPIIEALIQNAISFTKEDEIPAVHVYIYEEADKLIWEIKDHGIGFDNRQVLSLFAMFQSLHSSVDVAGVGIGASLALCQRRAERLGIAIRAKARVNEGASFKLIFPRHMIK